MYLPGEMAKVFENSGIHYNQQLLNPIENIQKYTTSSDIALNLGVYGVDLSYTKIFGQNEKTLLYISTIRKLSQQLGIPEEQFVSAFKDIEKNVSNKDSLSKYVNELYSQADKFLKENDRHVTAALVILGGWTETLYLATQIVDKDNKPILSERIAVQKYSLNSLMSLLNNYQNDITISKYLLLLRMLKKSFDKIEIYYEENDLMVDTINKMITTNKLNINLPPETINDIRVIIAAIRNEMIY